jgi:hypothetical protein
VTPVSTAGVSAAVVATSVEIPGTLLATATAAAVKVPRRKKFRRLKPSRQLAG